MITTRKLVSLGVGAAVAVLFSGTAFAQGLDKDAQKCIDQYNNKLRLVSAQAGKSATKCAQNAAKGKELAVDNCIVNNTDGKIAGKTSKVDALFVAGGKCDLTPAAPIQQGAATGNAAHSDALTEFARDLYGDPIVVVEYGKQSAKCIQKATQRPTQAFTEWVKGHRKCKKDAMKLGTVVDSATLDAECGTVAQADPKGKIDKKVTKSTTDITSNCTGTEESLATLFAGLDGACHASPAALAACINARAFCRACEALNTADGQDMDCDLIDDNTANGSCGGPPPAICELDSSSVLTLTTAALVLNPVPQGTIAISCGTPDGNGEAACACEVDSFDTIILPSIGDVCVNPASGCPTGTIDCDGGATLDIDLFADHNIGACGSNAACAGDCATFCTGVGASYTVLSSGCEGFCLGGSNAEAACTHDSACPGGSCVGKDPVTHPGVCTCACTSGGLGGASAAGDVACNLGVQINVELPSNGTCGDPPTIILPPQCGAVTTTTSTGIIDNPNNGDPGSPATLPAGGPAVLNGVATTCAALLGGNASGMELVGQLAFFDSTFGDIHSANTFVCE